MISCPYYSFVLHAMLYICLTCLTLMSNDATLGITSEEADAIASEAEETPQ